MGNKLNNIGNYLLPEICDIIYEYCKGFKILYSKEYEYICGNRVIDVWKINGDIGIVSENKNIIEHHLCGKIIQLIKQKNIRECKWFDNYLYFIENDCLYYGTNIIKNVLKFQVTRTYLYYFTKNMILYSVELKSGVIGCFPILFTNYKNFLCFYVKDRFLFVALITFNDDIVINFYENCQFIKSINIISHKFFKYSVYFIVDIVGIIMFCRYFDKNTYYCVINDRDNCNLNNYIHGRISNDGNYLFKMIDGKVKVKTLCIKK